MELGLLLQQLITTTRATASDIAVAMETNSQHMEEAIRAASECTNSAIQAASEHTKNVIQAMLNRSDAINQASLQAIFNHLNGHTGINTTYGPAASPATTLTAGKRDFTNPTMNKMPKVDPKQDSRHHTPHLRMPMQDLPAHPDPRPSRTLKPYPSRNPHEVPLRDPPRNLPNGGGGRGCGPRARRGGGDDGGGKRNPPHSGTPNDDDDKPDNTGGSEQHDSRSGDPALAPETQESFDWDQLGLSSWE
jgi:hypothetical protein